MADFPSVVPSARTYIPGSFASSSLPDMNGNETNIRHSSASYGHQLKLRFKSLPRADYESILNHYVMHGTFESFDLNTSVLVATNLSFPSGYKWRYSDRPEIDEDEGQIDVSVSLELLPPYNI